MNPGVFFQKGFEKLGVRFFLVDLVPTATLVFFLLALYWSGAPGKEPEIQKIIDNCAGLQRTEIFIIALVIFFLALLLQSWNTPMVRILEGYWGNSLPVRLLGNFLVAYHRRKRDKYRRWARTNQQPSELSERERRRFYQAQKRLRYNYPLERDPLPTLLGNTFRSFEEKAGGRYGLDTVTIWPRLYPLVNERLLAGINDLRDRLDLMVRIFWMAFITTILSLILLLSYPLWLLVPLLAFIMTLLSYQQIKRTAITYGILIETAFDLHHLDLLKALHLRIPGDIEEEIKNNQKLSRDLVIGRFPELKYFH